MRYNPKAKLKKSEVDFTQRYRHMFDPGYNSGRGLGPSGKPMSEYEQAVRRQKAMQKRLKRNNG